MRVSGRSVSAAVGVILAFWGTKAEGARVLSLYDLDSLVYMCEVVMGVEVGAATEVKTGDVNFQVHEVKVLEVFKGPAVAGQTVRVTGLD